MAYRKQVPQPRVCAQCGNTFPTARKGHVHCSGTCNTRAWRARQAATARPAALAATSPMPLRAPASPPPKPPAVTLAFTPQNVGTLAVGTAMGNLLSEGVKQLFAPAARHAPLATPRVPFPTWPPAELLAAAQPPQWVADLAWGGQLWLTPTGHHGHPLYLYAEAGLPYVLWQAPRGDWRLLTTPAELAQLAALPLVTPAIRSLQQQYGLAIADVALGLPLPGPAPELRQLGS